MRHPIAQSALNAIWRTAGGRLQLLAIFVPIALLLLAAGVHNSLSGSVYSAEDRVLVVGNRVSPLVSLPSRIADQIRGVVGAGSAVAGVTFLNGEMTGTRTQLPAILTSPEFMRANPDIVVTAIDLERWRLDPSSALIGATLARNAGLAIGDRIPVSFGGYSTALKGVNGLRVSGIYRIEQDRYAAVGLVLHNTLLTADGRRPPVYSAILVNVAGTNRTGRIAERIDALTQKLGTPTRTALRSEYAQLFNKRSREFESFLYVTVLSFLATALIVSIAVTSLIVRSLAQHWGVFDILGFKRRAVLLTTWGTFTLALCAAVGAAAGTVAITMVALQPLIRTVFVYFTISKADYLKILCGGLCAAVLVALVSVAVASLTLSTNRRSAA